MSSFPGSPKLIKGGFVIHYAACAQAFRLKEPAIESIKLDAEIVAADSLEYLEQKVNAVALGIAPRGSVVKPSSTELLAANALTQTGRLEILPAEAPLVFSSEA